MTTHVLELPFSAARASTRLVPQARPLSLIRTMLVGGPAVAVAAMLAWMVLLAADRLAPASTSILGAIASAGVAVFNFGLVGACLRDLRQT